MKETALHIKNLFIAAITAVAVVLFPRCTTGISGGGSEAGNARITGMVIDAQGSPSGDVIVQILPSDFDPVKDAPVDDSCIDTTADDGVYRFGVTKGGTYTIQAVQVVTRTRALIPGVEASKSDDTIADCMLQPPGAVRVMLSAGIDIGGYLYIPGTTFHVFLNDTSGHALLDSVPAGVVPSIFYLSTNRETPVVIGENVNVLSGDTVTIAFQDLAYSQRIILNTSVSGANIQEDVYGFPVLVRLSADAFDFNQAKTGGEDIRFTSSDGTPLPFEIEQWDAVARYVSIWVKVDTVRGNDSTQSITMYWGNPAATGASNGAAVFDTADGFQGVWHLDETGNDSAFDATANRFNGTASHMPENTATPGAIGNARAFDSSCITMPNTASGRLNFPEDGYFSVSAWVYVDTFDHVTYRAIVGKGFKQYFLRLSYLPGDTPFWQFTVFKESATWIMSYDSATDKQWVLLTGVRQGNTQSLYCNGERIAEISAAYPHTDTTILRDTSNDFSIGFLKEITYPSTFGCSYFKGMIDEVRIRSVACGADWIKLCYMNQRSDDRLVQFQR
jgi:hypothetical protein